MGLCRQFRGCHLLIRFSSGGVVAAGSGEYVESEVAASFDPLVVLLGQDRPDEPDQGGAIGEDPDHIGPPADFSIEAPLTGPRVWVNLRFAMWGSAVEPVEVVAQGV